MIYDPLIGAGIAELIRPNTRLIFTESPGSQTFEVQDIPAIASVARKHDLWLLMDNTWASPLYFRPFDHGVDVSIQNWRMVAAAPGITDEQKAAIVADVDKMVNSATWQKTLADKGWANTYLAGDAFAEQLKKDTESTAAILKDIGLVQ